MEVKRGIEKGMKMKIKMKTNIMIKITKKRWMAKIIDKEGQGKRKGKRVLRRQNGKQKSVKEIYK